MPIEQSTRGSNMDFRGRDSNDEVDGAAVSKAKEVSQLIHLSISVSNLDNAHVRFCGYASQQ